METITLSPDILDQTLSPELLRRMNAYWQPANYISVGQIYLSSRPRAGPDRKWSPEICNWMWSGTAPHEVNHAN